MSKLHMVYTPIKYCKCQKVYFKQNIAYILAHSCLECAREQPKIISQGKSPRRDIRKYFF